MSGHIFVTRGDLTALTCHAWLLPGNNDRGPGTDTRWLSAPSGIADQFERGRLCDPQPVGGLDRIWRIPRSPADPGAPQVYLMNSGGYHGLSLDWYLAGLDQFLEVVRRDHEEWEHGIPRERPLVGLPMFGTGLGGADQTRGGILKQALARLFKAVSAEETRADFVLVLRREQDFAAAQWARRALADEWSLWSELDSELEQTASQLATEARAGQLVLFLGAGVSTGAGLPGWSDLLTELAVRSDIDAQTREQLSRLPTLDQARYVESRLPTERARSLGAAVADLLKVNRVSLSHTLLAGLPVREVVTTNYDELFETASPQAGWPIAQLPYAPDQRKPRWILKLHGTVTEPSGIVLTREDYLGYHERRAALAGLVQGLLITKHMLFVGFSLADDNFHRIVHEVRNALRAQDGTVAVRTFGTALLVTHDPLLQELWKPDLNFASTVAAGMKDDRSLRAVRRLEILLDRLLAESATHNAHLLDPSYDELLSPEERVLSGHLRDFFHKARPRGQETPPAWAEVEALARSLGLEDPS